MDAYTAALEVSTTPPVMSTVAFPVEMRPPTAAVIPVPVPVLEICPPASVTRLPLEATLLAVAATVAAVPVVVSAPPLMSTVASPPMPELVTVTAEPVVVIALMFATWTVSSGFTGPTGVESDTPCVPETTVFGLFRLSVKPLEFV
jgi:hypothetical protein